MAINREKVREYLYTFDFAKLFIQEMGWSYPRNLRPQSLSVDGQAYRLLPIAQMSAVPVIEVSPIPFSAKEREHLHRHISQQYHENVLIFVDADLPTHRTQSVVFWAKRDGNKVRPREHLYLKGQPTDLFLSKLDAMVVEMHELSPDGSLPMTTTLQKLSSALDIERVTKKFYSEFSSLRTVFIDQIQGIPHDSDRFWYASVLLNRLMFIYFLQKRGFIQHNTRYLEDKLAQDHAEGFYRTFLYTLFFEGFAKPAEARSAQAQALLGEIKYLNGGLFLMHKLEERYPIQIPNQAFHEVFALFGRYSWYLDDTPGASDNEINPDVLGYIFEKYINQKAFGAYYTRPEITQYLCERTIHATLLDKLKTTRQFDDMSEVFLRLDAPLCRHLLSELPRLTILDPACGSGAFLVAAMKTLRDIYAAVFGKIRFLKDPYLTAELHKAEQHPSIDYYVRKRIITDNLYGVDIMEEATEIARLRLFLFLVSSAQRVDELEPLPNIDFNIMHGNSLVGLLAVDAKRFDNKGQMSLLQGQHAQAYQKLLDEKNRLINTYKNTAEVAQDKLDLLGLRQQIETAKAHAYEVLNELLRDDFAQLGIQMTSVSGDGKQTGKKPKVGKRPLETDDMHRLHPFHWGYEFDEIMGRGGFDVIIANPPWEVFQTDEKEFFQRYDHQIQKKKLDIKAWEKQREKLLQDPEIRQAWTEYESSFPYVSGYFKATPQYKNQHSIVNGKKAGGKINLYALFTEQAYNLLRPDGQSGIVIPSGIYTDLGAKQLREMLFNHTQITGLFGFENRKMIFEGVDSRFKFVVMTYRKGSSTESFPACFMRHEVDELQAFPQRDSLRMVVANIRKLAPDSLSIPEFKSDLDAHIADKMSRFPLLGEHLADKWNVKFAQEFNMTTDSHLFYTANHLTLPSDLMPTSEKHLTLPSPKIGEGSEGRENSKIGEGSAPLSIAQRHGEGSGGEVVFLPLFTGKMFHQFQLTTDHSGYWINEQSGRKALLGKTPDKGQKLDYQGYRWVHRRIASNTNERTLITTIAPPMKFTEVNSTTLKVIESGISLQEQLFFCAITNSFVLDWMLRQKVTTTLNMFYLYQLPVPRLVAGDRFFDDLVQRAGALICTTPEYDALAREIGLTAKTTPPLAPTPQPVDGIDSLKTPLTPKSPLPQQVGARGLEKQFSPSPHAVWEQGAGDEERSLEQETPPLAPTPLREEGNENHAEKSPSPMQWGQGDLGDGGLIDRESLRAEIDAMVAHVYGLSKDELAYILDTFPLVKADIKERVLKAYEGVG
jgi:hypothetical protein